MKERKLYSITEARALMGAISRNTMYALLNRGDIASVVIGCRRFVTQEAISEFIERSTTTAGPPLTRLAPESRSSRQLGRLLHHWQPLPKTRPKRDKNKERGH